MSTGFKTNLDNMEELGDRRWGRSFLLSFYLQTQNQDAVSVLMCSTGDEGQTGTTPAPRLTPGQHLIALVKTGDLAILSLISPNDNSSNLTSSLFGVRFSCDAVDGAQGLHTLGKYHP